MENSKFFTYSKVLIKQEKPDNDDSSTGNEIVVLYEVKQEPEENFVCVLPDIETEIEGHGGDGEKVAIIDKQNVHEKKAELSIDKNETLKEKITCKQCKTAYTSKQDLQNHIKSVHVREPSPIFQCSFCSSSFKQPNHLKSHIRKHQEKPSYLCYICGRQESTQAYLNRHILIHSSELPYHCDKCPKRFKTRKYILRHVLTHTPAERVKCDFCPARVHRYNMKFHLFTHGQKPFSCDLCSKTFAQKNKLTYHRRTHFGDKPFECSLCSRKFTYNQTLKDHFKIMHTNFVVKCDVCLKTYKSKQGLRSHLLRNHK